MRKRGKKAQFYLIAAIIIVVMIFGLSSVTNYVITKREPVKFYDLNEELKLESAEVVNYGLVSGDRELSDLINDFIQNYTIVYSQEKQEGVEPIFVYGNAQEMKAVTYTTTETGEINVYFGYGTNPGVPTFTITGGKKPMINETVLGGGEGKVTVNILDKDYNFDLNSGENFFFIITKKTDEETFVSKSGETTE